MLAGCGKNVQFTDLQITGASAAAARGALLLVPADKKAAVKSYMYSIAGAVRTLSGDATPEQLNDLLINSIPEDVRNQIPELVDIIIPAITSVYKTYYNQFSTDHARLLQILNDIATGIEAAATPNINDKTPQHIIQ